ncbi:MAG: multidrug transporter [Phycisphaerae bacterium]|nr:multidrug transporter [Phycisphaerae bacterium]
MADAAHTTRGNDPISWMSRNIVAANLIMLFLLLGGIGMAFFIKKEVNPDATLDVVDVRVSYPGASPEEVERGILLPVEEAVRGLEVVHEVISEARENSGRVSIELTKGTSRERGLQVINQAVDTITTFPEDTERPEVRLAGRRRDVLELRLFGDTSHWALFQVAEQVRDQLIRSGGVTQVEIDRNPQRIIHVEVSRDTLRAYGLTLDDVAARIADASDDVPAGRLETDKGNLAIRLKGRRQWAREFASIPIVDGGMGDVVRLEDIADVRDGFEETMFFSEFSGVPDVELGVYRVGDQTPTQVARAVEQAMRDMEHQLPAGIDWKITDNRADAYRDRLMLLLSNGALGMLLVLVLLGVFLQYRLAMWVTIGMFTSFVGTLLFLPLLGVSINMISMFAFLVALGIVVDDAIVVGENVYEYRERGMSTLDAAVQGVKDVAVPVTFGVITNCVAFAPLLFVPGEFGLIWATVPVVVITVFLISLVEALFILPAHLAHTPKDDHNPVSRFLHRRQQSFSGWVRRSIERWFRPVLETAVRYRYVTIAFFVATLTAVLGYAASDRMGMVLMPQVPSQEFAATARMPSDATDAESQRVADQLTAAALRVIEANGGDRLAEGIKSNVYGTTVSVDVILTRLDPRPITTDEFERLWRAETGPIPSANSLSFEMEGGFGWWRPDIVVDLSHPDIDTLNRASAELVERLDEYEVTSDVNDSYERGSDRLDFTLNPEGEALGLTPDEVGRQIRSAFQGRDATRFLRGPNEVRVRVKLPDDEQDSAYFAENLMIRTPAGADVPLNEVADITVGETFQSIERRQGRRIVTVDMDVNPSSQISRMLTTMRQDVLPELVSHYPGLSWSFQGQQVEMRESLRVLFGGLALALFTIYALIAMPFKSYVQPLIVMAAVPFGAFGAILGHMMLGHTLSVLSLMGIVGLSGVMVNDSLVMVDYANRLRRDDNVPGRDAILLAGVRRFRPIMLTTLTTFGGLAPIIFETSRQAQFLIPMAISLAFGILFATPIVLLIVPCFYVVVEDVKDVFRRLGGPSLDPSREVASSA